MSVKKEPFRVDELQKMYKFLCAEKFSLANSRLLTICLLSFSGFLRISECLNLTRSDLIFQDGYIKLFIEKSKTDVFREGHWVFVSRINSNLCPVKNLENYLQLANIDNDSDEFIFRALTSNKQQTLRKKNHPISYSRIRENLLDVCEKIGLNVSKYGTHSLRSGGVSAAANLGVKDRLLKKHGRWQTEGVKDRYITEDLNNLLVVSNTLGL